MIKDKPFSWLGKSLNAWKSFCQDTHREAEVFRGELEGREEDESQGLRRERKQTGGGMGMGGKEKCCLCGSLPSCEWPWLLKNNKCSLLRTAHVILIFIF